MRGKKTNIFCNAKQKESGVELQLKGVENINSTVDSVESGSFGAHGGPG